MKEKAIHHAAMTSRRRFLKLGAKLSLLAVTAGASRQALANSLNTAGERRLSFYQTHTGETLSTVYWADGVYIPESLAEVNRILRDHRTGEVAPIRTELLDLLHRLRSGLDTSQHFQIISGYRSHGTNEMLATRGRGVATRSLHMEGMAVDIRVPGRDLKAVRDLALTLGRGGVGYYPAPDFVHVDVGRVRHW